MKPRKNNGKYVSASQKFIWWIHNKDDFPRASFRTVYTNILNNEHDLCILWSEKMYSKWYSVISILFAKYWYSEANEHTEIELKEFA